MPQKPLFNALRSLRLIDGGERSKISALLLAKSSLLVECHSRLVMDDVPTRP